LCGLPEGIAQQEHYPRVLAEKLRIRVDMNTQSKEKAA
jgi:hypothetical protein